MEESRINQEKAGAKLRNLQIINIILTVLTILAIIASAMKLLLEHSIAREITGKSRNRLFVYDQYLAVINQGTEVP